MKNQTNEGNHFNYATLIKTVRLTIILFLTFNFTILANSFGQKKISLDVQNTSVVKVLDEIEASTDYKFIYNVTVFDFNKELSLNVKEESIKDVLDEIFENKLDYEVIDNKVILKEKAVTVNDAVTDEEEAIQRTITGNVTDSDGNPLPGASVVEVGTANGTSTDFDGNYSLELENDSASLQFSFIGFESQTVAVGNSDNVNVSLAEADSSLDEVVVTGYGTQLRRNITGSVATIDSEVIENRALTSAGAALSGTTAVSYTHLRAHETS